MNLVCRIVALAAVGVGFYLGESGALGAPPRRNDESRDVRPGRDVPPERARVRDGQGRRPEMREHRRQAMRHFMMKHHRHHHHRHHGHHGRPNGGAGKNFRGPHGGDVQGMHRGPQMRGGPGNAFQNDRRGPQARPNFDGSRRGPDFRGPQDSRGRGNTRPGTNMPEGPRDGN
jgi:hypothetical protein